MADAVVCGAMWLAGRRAFPTGGFCMTGVCGCGGGFLSGREWHVKGMVEAMVMGCRPIGY